MERDLPIRARRVRVDLIVAPPHRPRLSVPAYADGPRFFFWQRATDVLAPANDALDAMLGPRV
jgi:hypothetical protein